MESAGEEKRKSMKNKLNIILYGVTSQGKTTSLMKLAILLAGNGIYDPKIEAEFNKRFSKSKGTYKDGRIIVNYKGILVYIATGGDSWQVCRLNYEFFDGKFNKKPDVFVFDAETKTVESLSEKDYKKYKSQVPEVSVGACRPNNDGWGPIKAIHSATEKTIFNYAMQVWVRKDRSKCNDKQARELLCMIDNFIDCGSVYKINNTTENLESKATKSSEL